MRTEQNFGRLIETAWKVTEGHFDENTFLEWRKRAVEYLTEMLGPGHYYTQCFGDRVSQTEATGILAGIGVLSAAKEQMVNGYCELRSTINM